MPVRFKYDAVGGGAWRNITNGNIALKSGAVGGGSWIRPSLLKVKNNGAIGAGAWVDSDYVGYPAEPVSFAVNAWSFTTISMKWAPGVGGATPANYDIQQRAQNGTTVIATQTDTASPSANFTVAEDTKYQFFVRAKSAGGLISDWVGPIKVQIGHAASSHTTTTPDTRPWSGSASVNGYRDVAVGVVVPSTVVMTSIRFQLSAYGGFTSVLSVYNNREIYMWINNADVPGARSWLNPVDTTVALNNTSIGGFAVQGFVCRGAGWSTTSTGAQRVVGTVSVAGTEHYNRVITVTDPAVANSYW
jgi:hypothetical protein